MKGNLNKQPRNGYVGRSYTESDNSDLNIPLIMVMRRLKHKRNRLIQLVYKHCNFPCLYILTMDGIKEESIA